MKTIWHPGVPTVPGIYWFDPGIRMPRGMDEDYTPYFLKTNGETPILFHNYYSGDINFVYHEKVCKKACYAHIEKPTTWHDHKCIKGEHVRAWAKDPSGHLAVTIVEADIRGGISGDFIWVKKSGLHSECSKWIRANEGYLYSPIEFPSSADLETK